MLETRPIHIILSNLHGTESGVQINSELNFVTPLAG